MLHVAYLMAVVASFRIYISHLTLMPLAGLSKCIELLQKKHTKPIMVVSI